MNQKIQVLVSDDPSDTSTGSVTGESLPSGTVDIIPEITETAEAYPMPTATKTLWFHRDHLGTPRAVTNENGDVESLHDYTPFGIELPSNYVSPNTRQFTGQERDRETGLDYFIARYMNPRDCRFTQVDPIKGSAGSPQSWNAYAYAANNPMKYIDPSGMSITGIATIATGGFLALKPGKSGNSGIAYAHGKDQAACAKKTLDEETEPQQEEIEESVRKQRKWAEMTEGKDPDLRFKDNATKAIAYELYMRFEPFETAVNAAVEAVGDSGGTVTVHTVSFKATLAKDPKLGDPKATNGTPMQESQFGWNLTGSAPNGLACAAIFINKDNVNTTKEFKIETAGVLAHEMEHVMLKSFGFADNEGLAEMVGHAAAGSYWGNGYRPSGVSAYSGKLNLIFTEK